MDWLFVISYFAPSSWRFRTHPFDALINVYLPTYLSEVFKFLTVWFMFWRQTFLLELRFQGPRDLHLARLPCQPVKHNLKSWRLWSWMYFYIIVFIFLSVFWREARDWKCLKWKKNNIMDIYHNLSVKKERKKKEKETKQETKQEKTKKENKIMHNKINHGSHTIKVKLWNQLYHQFSYERN